MRRQGGGSIINMGSTAGIRPRPGLTWYNASKGAVNLLSRSMAVELAPDKIRVNCIAPVMGATGLLEYFMGLPDTPENRASSSPPSRSAAFRAPPTSPTAPLSRLGRGGVRDGRGAGGGRRAGCVEFAGIVLLPFQLPWLFLQGLVIRASIAG